MEKTSDTNHHCYNLRQVNRTSHKISKPTITETTKPHQQEQSQMFRMRQYQETQPTRYTVDNDADFRQLVQKLTGAAPPAVKSSISDNMKGIQQMPSGCNVKLAQQKSGQIQEKMKDAVTVMDCGSEITSEPDLVSTNGLHYRVNELSSVDPVATLSQEVTSSLNDNGMLNENPPESLLGSEPERTLQQHMPPNFTVNQDQRKLLEEVDLNSQILGDMSCSSFHDMLANLEQMITEVGGDLTL